MVVGGTLGILFVTLLRRVMVEDPELPFPESVAAAEIHKAGQQGARRREMLFAKHGDWARRSTSLGAFNCSPRARISSCTIGELGKSVVRLGSAADAPTLQRGRRDHVLGAGHQPGLSRRGLHHRAAAGGAELRGRRARVGPAGSAAHRTSWVRNLSAAAAGRPTRRWAGYGGARSGATSCGRSRWAACWWAPSYTLFRMRKNLGIGHEARGGRPEESRRAAHEATGPHRARPEQQGGLRRAGRDVRLHDRAVLLLRRARLRAAVVAAIVMIVLGFFFAAVSGNLVGMIGSSNNPISGLTLSHADHRRAADGGHRA